METEQDDRPVTPTERKVAEMLLENTGSHFLDSGGAYGRAWQHARAKYGLNPSQNSTWSGGPLGPDPDPTSEQIEQIARVMRSEPDATIDSYGTLTLDTFHFLVNHLDYDPALDAKFQRWVRVHNMGKDRYDADYGFSLIGLFADALAQHGTVGGLYGDSSGLLTENSYNGECALDRTIQLGLFTYEPTSHRWHVLGHNSETGETRMERYHGNEFLPEDSYVLLQIHGGADVRGGYTEPVLFRMGDEYGILDWARATIGCDDGHRWESENGGYTYNLDGVWGWGERVLTFDKWEAENGRRHAERALDLSLSSTPKWHCPIDASPLHAYAW